MKSLLFLFSLSFFKFCTSGKIPPQTNPIVITTCGATVTIPVNSTFSIKLPVTQGTGYDWAIVSESNSSVVEPFKGEARFENNSNNEMTGTPATQVFDRKTTNTKGTNIIELHYRRSWEKNKAPEQVCRVTISVE